MIVPVILGFYFVVCISIVLFNVWNLISGYILQKQFLRRKQTFLHWISESDPQAPGGMVQVRKRFFKTLRSSLALLTFHAALEDLETATPDQFAALMPWIAELLQDLFPFYEGKSEAKRAYYSYLLSHFQVLKHRSSEPILSFLQKQLQEDQSLYSQENALRAIYSSGQASLVCTTLIQLNDQQNRRIHPKILVEGLLTFDKPDELIHLLWEIFPQFCEEMRVALLDYMRFASGAWKTEMLDLISSADTRETQIACLRYFGKYPDHRFRPILQKLAEQDKGVDWELRAVCMTVLVSYPGKDTISWLKEGLSSRNWYIRSNAADSLRKLSVYPEMVQDILEGSDQYAKQMLQYRLQAEPAKTGG